MKTTPCSVAGCGRDQRKRGVCSMHYDRLRRSGELDLLPVLSLAERLWSRIVEQPNGCHVWVGTTAKGYGTISRGARSEGKVSTHRLVWELTNGPIPDGLDVLHHCDNPPCCQTNPTEGYPEGHLFLGTHAQNMVDRDAKGRNGAGKVQLARTHCPQGHAYDEFNTYHRPDRPGRACRTCSRESSARYEAKRRVA